MTLEELKQDIWYLERPEIIKKAIEIIPPINIYMFKDSKKECFIVGYTEPEDGDEDPNHVTLIVQKTGVGGHLAAMGLGNLDTNRVFGVALTDLELSSHKQEEES